MLDEPSIGLHTRDTARLIRILKDLRDLGNTILVVEHDPDVHSLRRSPARPRPRRGRIWRQGAGRGHGRGNRSQSQIAHRPLSVRAADDSRSRRAVACPANSEWLRLRGARANNLKNLDCEIPLGMLVGITGVSGSGKSTLVHQCSLSRSGAELGRPRAATRRAFTESSKAHERLNEVVLVDQTPIGRTPRSNPVTYIKAFDPIRELFAAQPEAKKRGYAAGHFSFNVPGGRCEVCEGDGTVTVEMQFLADVELPCEECNGTRYKPNILDVKYKGKNIHEVLNMTVKEALRFFVGNPKILDRLAVLDEVGLGYVRLGQSATTLSGGEAQRVKLASHLGAAQPSRYMSDANGTTTARSRAASSTFSMSRPPGCILTMWASC